MTNDVPEGFKRCPKCGQVKTVEGFYRDKTKNDGRQSYCKSCRSEHSRRKYWQNPEQRRAVARRWYYDNPERKKEYDRRYRQENGDVIREQERDRYHSNPEKRREATRRWRDKNHDRVLEYARNYYRENTDKARKSSRQWKQNNPEQVRAGKRRNYQRNAKRINEQQRNWKNENREKVREIIRRRKIRKRRAKVMTPANIEAILWDVQNGQCMYCGCDLTDGYHLDHIIPIAIADLLGDKHPGHVPSNLVLACPHCNMSKNNAILEDWLTWKYPDQIDEILHRVEAHIAIMQEWEKEEGD